MANDIEEVKKDIEEVMKAIEKVEQDILGVERALKESVTGADVAHLRKKKEQLRKKEEQLRKEKEQLREEKLLLRRAELSGQGAAALRVDKELALATLGPFDWVPNLPEVDRLTELLKRPLIKKIPTQEPAFLVRKYGEIFEASKDETAPKMLYFFWTCILGPAIGPGRGEIVAGTYLTLVFSLMEQIGNDLLKLPISTFGDTEDISCSVNHPKKRRDLFVSLNGKPGTGGIPVLLAEHKDKSLGDAKIALISKHRGSNASVYGDLEYMFGYAAGDGKVQFYVLPVAPGVHSVPLLQELDMRKRADRTTFAIAVTNILRWMHSLFKLKKLCITGIPFLLDTYRVDPRRIGLVTVHIGLNHVMKTFSLPLSVFADFKELYSCLYQKEIPHAAVAKKVVADGVQLYQKPTGSQKKKLKKILDGSGIVKIELHIQPVGCPVDPETLSSERVVQMTREVLLCLEALHQRGFCHYDVRVANIILWKQKFYVIDFELAGKTNSQIKLQLNFPWWNENFKDSYDVKNDLYMLGKHVIQRCHNSPTKLQQLGKELVECKWATATDAKERLVTLFSGVEVEGVV